METIKRNVLVAIAAFGISQSAHAAVVTFNNLAAFNAAIGAASVIVEDFTTTTHFPISTGVLNAATNLPAIGITPGVIQPGVTYSTAIGSGNFFNIDCCATGTSTQPFLDTVTGVGPLTVTFDNNTNAFGFLGISQFMGNNLTIQINFAAGPSFTDTAIALSGNQFVGFVSTAADISSALIGGGGSTFTFAIDDFRFVSVPSVPSAQTPEPGSVLLIGLGLAGLVALRRRKRAA